MTQLDTKWLKDYSFETLRDVALSAPADRYLIGYNGSTQKWEEISPEFTDRYHGFYSENEVVSQTTSLGLVLKLQVETPPLIAGQYMAEFMLEYGSSKENQTQGYQVNWRELGLTAFTPISDITEPSVANANRPMVAFKVVPIVNSGNSLQIQILFGRSGGGSNVVTVQRVRTRVMRFGA